MRTAAIAAGLCAFLASGATKADVIYDYLGTSPVTPPVGAPITLAISLDIRDAAVGSGAFTLSGVGAAGNPSIAKPGFSGDVADFVSLTSSSLFGPATLSSFAGLQTFDLSLTFNPANGAVTSSSFVSHSNEEGDATITGTGASASGSFGSDDPRFSVCSPTNTCPISGTWTQVSAVPEPAAFTLLGASLVALGASRRQLR